MKRKSTGMLAKQHDVLYCFPNE